MRLAPPNLVFCAALVLCAPAAQPHPGGTDGNGCHYERSSGKDWQDTYHCHEEQPPNPDVAAPVKKSRENICHDSKSPNYKQLQRFISYQIMKQCTASGGRPYLR